MARYELSDGASSKFWDVAVEDATLTVRFGRIGTQGQTRSKTFADTVAAEKEKAKLIQEKTGKGYVMVGDAAPEVIPASELGPMSTSAATEPTPVAATPPMQSGKLLDAAPLPTRTRPQSRPDAFGSAEAAWASLKADLPGYLAETDAAVQSAVERSRMFSGRLTAAIILDRRNTSLRWLEERLGNPPPATITVDEAALFHGHFQKIYSDHPEYSGPVHFRPGFSAKVDAFTQWLVAAKGAAFAMQVADRAMPPSVASWSDPVAVALRMALPQVPEAEYAEALAWCLAACQARPGWERAANFAFMLADDRRGAHALQPLAVLEDAARQGVDAAKAMWLLLPLIVEAPPSAAAAWRVRRTPYHIFFHGTQLTLDQVAATAIATARATQEAALPTLSWLLQYCGHEDRTTVAKALLETQEPGALVQLLPFLHEKWIREAIDLAVEAYPETMFRQCLGVIAAGRNEPAIRARILEAIQRHGAATLRGWAGDLGSKAVGQLEGLIGLGTARPAPAESWPQVLRTPPWRQKPRKATDDIVLAIAPIPTPFAYPAGDSPDPARRYWRGGQPLVVAALAQLPDIIREAEKAPPSYNWVRIPAAQEALPEAGTPTEDVIAWLERRLSGMEPLAVNASPYVRLYDSLDQQPEPLALMLWSLTPTLVYSALRWGHVGRPMLSRFGRAAVPGLIKVIESDPLLGLDLADTVDDGAIAPHAARALLRLKKARGLAAGWLRRHPRTALTRLVPDAVGKPGEARDAAEHVLRWFHQDGGDGAALLAAAVADYAAAEPRVAEAVAQVTGRDPLTRVPSKIAKLPAWFSPGTLSRPILRSGGALPEDALAALAEMLSFSTPDAVYAGIPAVREACTPESLGAFAWDLFSAWMAAGAPARDGWTLRAVGWLGDDECARQLTRLIRKWPGEAAHARAVTGLDVLADIGTDVALMNLNGIAEKLKFKGLQEKAREKIAALAEARDLSPEELADRLAPDLDLDERGGLDLDFGPRHFRVGFDEALRPWVKDAAGARLKDLPKPGKADDVALSDAAVKRWAAVKKDARAIASLQLVRLEAMLMTARRLRPAVFRPFFASHPLIRHLAQRLVWGVYAGPSPVAQPRITFRVTEALDLTDARDDAVDLDLSEAAEGLIGLVHPLQMPEGELQAWSTLFGDYEIAQPFPQLGRETFALTEAEKAGSVVKRFEGRPVEAARLRGMGARGWPLGAAQDGGAFIWLERKVTLADGKTALALLEFGDGLFAGAADLEEKIQTLHTLRLRPEWRSAGKDDIRFGDLDAVTASEILRAATLLAEAART